jgi:hypothetical protein
MANSGLPTFGALTGWAVSDVHRAWLATPQTAMPPPNAASGNSNGGPNSTGAASSRAGPSGFSTMARLTRALSNAAGLKPDLQTAPGQPKEGPGAKPIKGGLLSPTQKRRPLLPSGSSPRAVPSMGSGEPVDSPRAAAARDGDQSMSSQHQNTEGAAVAPVLLRVSATASPVAGTGGSGGSAVLTGHRGMRRLSVAATGAGANANGAVDGAGNSSSPIHSGHVNLIHKILTMSAPEPGPAVHNAGPLKVCNA